MQKSLHDLYTRLCVDLIMCYITRPREMLVQWILLKLIGVNGVQVSLHWLETLTLRLAYTKQTCSPFRYCPAISLSVALKNSGARKYDSNHSCTICHMLLASYVTRLTRNLHFLRQQAMLHDAGFESFHVGNLILKHIQFSD